MAKKKVVNEKLEKLQEQVRAVFNTGKEYQWEDFECEAIQSGDQITVTVSKMYDHLPLTFIMLRQLSEIFGTMEFDVNEWSHGGCGTCEYGSRFAHEFSYKVKADGQ
jgi:hypothetical protein